MTGYNENTRQILSHTKFYMRSYKRKKVLIMGLGLHGGALSVVRWFIREGAQIRITDLKTRQELLSSVAKIPHGKVQFILGRHRRQDFLWADVVVRNPGVPRESSFLSLAEKHGAIVENEATLFFELVGRKRIIGVTGTRGKSTTATLLYQMLHKKYRHAVLGGNMPDFPMFSILPHVKNTREPIVIELSSWHLEDLGRKKISPHTAIFTNLYPDHLNRYSNMRKYLLAKENIFKYQATDDIIVLNKDNSYTRSLNRKAPSKTFWFTKKSSGALGCYIKKNYIYFKKFKVTPLSSIRLLGDHNKENVLAAICAAKLFKISNSDIQNALKNFHGLQDRLEYLGVKRGRKFYNDTTATTPDGTIAALKTLSRIKNPRTRTSSVQGRQELRIKNIVLIAGGSDKGILQEKFNELAELIRKHCKAVVLFSGAGSEKIKKSLTACRLPLTAGIKTMSDALGIAKSFAKRGDIILLSPACASFGLFLHEFDRGEQFKKAFRGI